MSIPSLPVSSSPSVATLYRNIWRYAAGKRVQLLASSILLVASQVAKLVVPWLAAQAINELQQGGTEAVLRAALWVGAVLLVYSGAWGLHGPGRVLERSVGVHVRQGIAAALYAKLTHAPLAWHERHHSGDIQHRVNQASHALYDFAQNQFMYLQNAVNFVGPLAALWLLSPTTGWVGLIGYVIVGMVIVRFDIVLMRLAERENRAERRYAAGLLDFIGNIATVMSLRLQASTQRLLGRRLDAVFEPLKRTIVVNEMKWCAVDVMSICLTWGLVVAFVWETRSHGAAVLIGTVFMIYQYGQQAGSVIGTMAANFQSFAKTRTDFASADVIWAAPERVPAERSLPADWQQIQIRDLSFAHAGANDDGGLGRGGLSHVSLTLRRGERVALVGPSGSGKSTLMRVLAGLYETPHGHYEADGVVQLGVRHLGAISTLIPQEADVFEATVRENITFDEPCEPSQLMAAVHASAFDDVLHAMPLGLDTPISERGFNMSGGQRQRLCLARGMLAARDSSLILLDEPTSALDPVTEALVHRRLDTSFAGACIVASVHRMGLLEQFDRVVLMVAGQVVDSGSAEELAQRQPAFEEMLNAHRREDRAPVAA